MGTSRHKKGEKMEKLQRAIASTFHSKIVNGLVGDLLIRLYSCLMKGNALIIAKY